MGLVPRDGEGDGGRREPSGFPVTLTTIVDLGRSLEESELATDRRRLPMERTGFGSERDL